MNPLLRGIALLALLMLFGGACTGDDAGNDDIAGEDGGGPGDSGECATVDVAVSSEKIDLLTELARTFNESDAAQVAGGCVFVQPFSKASGLAMSLLADDWPDEETNGSRPEIWSPAASSWALILNQLRADAGKPPMAPESPPFMLSPLVIAMPEPMATALGYPGTPIGFADILALARDAAGWGAFGHPEWGPFRLG